MTILEAFLLIGLIVLTGIVIELHWRVKAMRSEVKNLIDLKTITEGMIAAVQSMDTEKDDRIEYLEDMFDRIGLDPDTEYSLGDIQDIAKAIEENA